jgi:transcriptional regulator of acetoin/glycerol metabolism
VLLVVAPDALPQGLTLRIASLQLERSPCRRRAELAACLAPRRLPQARTCERKQRPPTPRPVTRASGTGKRSAATYRPELPRQRAVHRHQLRRLAPAPLLESTLAGHKRGAFTGAVLDAPGLSMEAHGGTLFLTSSGDMDPARCRSSRCAC